MLTPFKNGCPNCMKICFMLGAFFKGDGKQAKKWLQTPNPGLGNVTPEKMIDDGREEKLSKWMYNRLEENWRL